MSNLMEVIKSRRSTRAFKSELPPKDQIMQIVEAAEWAPSGMGKYLWHFTVIYNAEKSLKLARAVAEADNRGPEYNFYGAPVNIIISYKRDEHHTLVDGAAAMENLLLMATELGLGSCWINQLRETCDVPEVRALLTEYGVRRITSLSAPLQSATSRRKRRQSRVMRVWFRLPNNRNNGKPRIENAKYLNFQFSIIRFQFISDERN